MKIAIYPGSFDPITNGHIDLIQRAKKIFDKVIVVVAINPNKASTFSVEQRMDMIQKSIANLDGVEVDATEGLTLSYAKSRHACAIVRGLRAVTDYEFEFQINAANEFIDPSIDTIFLFSRREYNFISSSAIKELFEHGIDISPLVPKAVLDYMQQIGK